MRSFDVFSDVSNKKLLKKRHNTHITPLLDGFINTYMLRLTYIWDMKMVIYGISF